MAFGKDSLLLVLLILELNEGSLAYSLCDTYDSFHCNGTKREQFLDVPYLWNRGTLSESTTSLVVEGVFICLIMLPSLLGNGALIATVIFEERFRTPTNLIVINQCIVDLGITLIVELLSLVAIAQGGWLLAPFWCMIQILSVRFLLSLTIVNFAILGIDRYIVIVKAKSLNRFNRKQAFWICCCLWTITFPLSFSWDMFLFPSEIWIEVTTSFCYPRYRIPVRKASTATITVQSILLLIIPGLIILFCFYYIFGAVRTNRRKVGPSTVSNWRKIAVAVYAKSAYTSVAVLTSFCLCAVPFFAAIGLGLIGKNVSSHAMSTFKYVLFANTAIKPIIYMARSEPWSKKLRRILSKKPRAKPIITNSPAARRSSRYVVAEPHFVNKNSAVKTGSGLTKEFSCKDFHELFSAKSKKQAWDNIKE